MRIYLIGMMGSGKTTVGKELSKMFDYTHVDTDYLIENKMKMSIKQIIESKGITEFRQLEQNVLFGIKTDNVVISTGGGIILNDKNVEYMKRTGLIIYLKLSLDVLKPRLDKEELAKRPLLKNHSLESIYNERRTLYETVCDEIIMCDKLSINEICIEIIKKARI